ncbi:MAG: hypothetical protein ACTHU0_03500 [Kofleriaceae bacterium]
MKYFRAVVATVAFVGCGDCDGGGFPDAAEIDGPPPGGTLSLAWTLTNANGQPITCDQVGAQTVTLLVRNLGAQGGQTEVFSCSSGMGVTPALAVGKYDVRFELVSGSGHALAMAPLQSNVEVRSGEQTRLSPVTFAVDAVGALALFITANQPGDNCGAIAASGAGITSTTITLVHNGGGCEPITIQVAAGAARPASTYTVNCASPVIAPCIDSDQRLTATDVPADGYAIHVRGKIGATDCYANDDLLQVPPLGGTVSRTLNLTRLTSPGC